MLYWAQDAVYHYLYVLQTQAVGTVVCEVWLPAILVRRYLKSEGRKFLISTILA
jgi:hypothetical protein